ncbi:hypothetical protein [Turicibacter sanguinis]|uniref:hypothetical protein n=1 Tax=Turicibacter sanguinis TaxID=154288 RepID=UPI00232C90C2|nr:hypothetical protein [Turicibacter sanguinis]MDB8576036.1 hypothetical protein [Turicibacter sanguinis]MDB8579097.1 hypothetical protein [Turicibacter sanguinis]MDB8584940.1 hypothetical protein [Turicibacter sanguinis]MDB8587916.1 hypothetical protein [Turicibacter sanguinis]MDB8598677.1 hypothetical protein [Turicibacter sanguinis]
MNYFEYLADLLLNVIPDDSSDLPQSTSIIINDFMDGDIYHLEYKGYSGLMANPNNGHTGGNKIKLGYFDFKVHTGRRYFLLYNYSVVTHYNLFRDLISHSNLENCVQVYRGINPFSLTQDINEQKALLGLALLMFEQEVNWGNLNFQKNSNFPPDLNNPNKNRPRDMIMGMLIQAFELGIDNVSTWKVNRKGYKTTAYFGVGRYENYDRKEYFEERLCQLNGGRALMTGKYRERFMNKVSNKRNNPHFNQD